MAVSENDLVVGPLTPAAGVTTISLDFYFEQASWLEVYKSGSETPLVLNTDYTVSGAGTISGVVTLTTPANGTDEYAVYLSVPLERSSDMQLRGEFKSDPFNIEMDRIWQRLQYHDTLIRSKFGVGRTANAPGILNPVNDRVIGFDGDGGLSVAGSTRAQLDAAVAFINDFSGSAPNTATAISFTADWSGATDPVLRTLQSKLEEWISVKDFGAVGDGVTDDTTAIQNAINAAATTGKYKVFFPSGHYVVSTIYDHYDAINNPGYPSGNFYQGRIRLIGEKQTDLNQLLYVTDYKGVLIETSDAVGPALKMGNGNSADATTARRSAVEHIGFLGTCTGSVVELDGAAQHTLLAHLSVYNKGGSGGKGLYIHSGFYACKVTDVHVASSGGDGLVCETASMALFDTVNVTNCGGTAWVLGRASTGADDLGFGTGSTFINCQGRNSSNGLEIMGGRSNFFSGWWLEQNDGDFDLKIHENASNYVFQGMLLISTELSVASAIVGGNSGTSYRDACRGIKMQAMAFHFCGPTSSQAGVLKYGSCADLTLDKCSFKNNGGRGLIIDTSAGVTPTILIDPDFDPVGASAPIGNLSKVVDQSGTSSPWLVRGLDYVGTITSDLDMSSWTHLPDAINCQTSSNITVTLPSSVAKFIGKTITLRKTLGGNTLAIAGNINGAASVSYTADDSVATFIAHQNALFSEISQPTRVVAQAAPSDPSGGTTVDTEARATLALLIDRLQSSGVLT